MACHFAKVHTRGIRNARKYIYSPQEVCHDGWKVALRTKGQIFFDDVLTGGDAKRNRVLAARASQFRFRHVAAAVWARRQTGAHVGAVVILVATASPNAGRLSHQRLYFALKFWVDQLAIFGFHQSCGELHSMLL